MARKTGARMALIRPYFFAKVESAFLRLCYSPLAAIEEQLFRYRPRLTFFALRSS
jgi:hypothetical protein